MVVQGRRDGYFIETHVRGLRGAKEGCEKETHIEPELWTRDWSNFFFLLNPVFFSTEK